MTAPTLYVLERCVPHEGVREASPEEVMASAKRLVQHRVRRGAKLLNPKSVHDYLVLKYAAHDHEVFGVIFLDTRGRVIAAHELFRGTLDAASVHVREIVKESLLLAAASVIVYHLHPSGDPTPSAADERVTEQIGKALGLLDIALTDHLIVGGSSVYSFASEGRL
jgi:DNA repair protein RadC